LHQTEEEQSTHIHAEACPQLKKKEFASAVGGVQ